MGKLNDVENEFMKEMGDVRSWCSGQYRILFEPYLGEVSELYLSLKENKDKISDKELEHVLTYLPLQLMEVSEQLSQYKLNNDCLKLHIKKLEANAIIASSAKTVSEKKEFASLQVMDYKVLSNAYSSLIDRVENEINFGREFIMTAKKIWDARMRTYEANPISGDINSLDTYVSE